MQSALCNLCRAELRALADRYGTARAILEHFFEANVRPDAEVLTKLEAWFADHSRRLMFNDPRRIKALDDILPIESVGDFIADHGGLPAEL